MPTNMRNWVWRVCRKCVLSLKSLLLLCMALVLIRWCLVLQIKTFLIPIAKSKVISVSILILDWQTEFNIFWHKITFFFKISPTNPCAPSVESSISEKRENYANVWGSLSSALKYFFQCGWNLVVWINHCTLKLTYCCIMLRRCCLLQQQTFSGW